ncbi:MAG: hypothetical protein IPJ13_10520 [Saprospiraceae bacterium]|nr:hypothetical protein [Saprospiraceae bacterium]
MIIFYSEGCSDLLGFEISVKSERINKLSCDVLINYIYTLVVQQNIKISDNQTMAFYSWLIKFVKLDGGRYEIYELNPYTKNFTAGIFYSTNLLTKQKKICALYDVSCDFPHFGEMIAVSEGYDNSKISCERHERESTDCGWYITSDLYNGDYKSMKLIHFSHFAIVHYDVLEYFSLPAGFSITLNELNVTLERIN